jgi:hypothetical protein
MHWRSEADLRWLRAKWRPYAKTGPQSYVNFGCRRIGDITVTILKRNERSFAAAGLDLRGLAGRRIRVRGWIEARGGERTWIEAERPEQIEIAD